MSANQESNTHNDGKLPVAGIGNASNPSPRNEELDANTSNQLIDKKGEKYLREVASIEDVPDAEDQQDMDRTFEKEKSE
jgi:hypothetical protein